MSDMHMGEEANIKQMEANTRWLDAQTIEKLLFAGFKRAKIVEAVTSNDFNKLL